MLQDASETTFQASSLEPVRWQSSKHKTLSNHYIDAQRHTASAPQSVVSALKRSSIVPLGEAGSFDHLTVASKEFRTSDGFECFQNDPGHTLFSRLQYLMFNSGSFEWGHSRLGVRKSTRQEVKDAGFDDFAGLADSYTM